MKLTSHITGLLFAAVAAAQPPITHTASVDTSSFAAISSDQDVLLAVVGIGIEAGNTVTVRDPAIFAPTLVPVRLEPVWIYARETRPDLVGLRPCFHALADNTCEAARSFPLNAVTLATYMPPVENVPSMPYVTVWRIDYPGGPVWRGGPGTPELTVVWFRVVML